MTRSQPWKENPQIMTIVKQHSGKRLGLRAALVMASVAGIMAGAGAAAPVSLAQSASLSKATEVPAPWRNLPVKVKTVTCPSGGTVQYSVQFQSETIDNDVKYRLNPDQDLIVSNNTSHSLAIYANTYGSDFNWVRLSEPTNSSDYVVSSYYYNNTALTIPAGQTKILSVDSADRWRRQDGVADSNASPASTPLSNASLPAVMFRGSSCTTGYTTIEPN